MHVNCKCSNNNPRRRRGSFTSPRPSKKKKKNATKAYATLPARNYRYHRNSHLSFIPISEAERSGLRSRLATYKYYYSTIRFSPNSTRHMSANPDDANSTGYRNTVLRHGCMIRKPTRNCIHLNAASLKCVKGLEALLSEIRIVVQYEHKSASSQMLVILIQMVA